MTKEIKKVMNLDNPIPEDSLNGYLFSNENKGHKFIISCTKGGELQTLTGSVTVRFMRANNTTILLGQGGSDGRENYAQIVDGNAEVTLHPDCYNVPGRFKISVFNNSGDTVSCIYVGVGTVSRTQNGELIDSGEIVPSIDELVGYIDDCITATENAEAAADHAVRYDVAQTLIDTQRTQARTNIDASSQSDVDDLKSAVNRSSLLPPMRNGSIANTGNTTNVAFQYIYPYHNATRIKFTIKRPLSAIGNYYAVLLNTYTIDSGITYEYSNSSPVRVTKDKELDTYESVYIYPGMFDNTSIGFAISFYEKDSSGTAVPVRVASISEGDISVEYDYSDSTVYDFSDLISANRKQFISVDGIANTPEIIGVRSHRWTATKTASDIANNIIFSPFAVSEDDTIVAGCDYMDGFGTRNFRADALDASGTLLQQWWYGKDDVSGKSVMLTVPKGTAKLEIRFMIQNNGTGESVPTLGETYRIDNAFVYKYHFSKLKIEDDIYKYIGNKRIPVDYINRYIDTSGATVDRTATLATTGGKRLSIVSCNAGDIFTIDAVGGESNRAWCFIKSDGTVISVASENAYVNSLTMVAPAESAYLIINNADTTRTSYYGGFMPKNIYYYPIAYTLPTIIVPKQSFAVVGHEWNLYYENIIDNLNLDTMFVYCDGISGAKAYKRFLRWTPAAGDAGTTKTVTVNVYNRKTRTLITSATFELVISANTTTQKKIIFIGDSLTQNGIYLHEIQYVLSGGNYVSVGTRNVTDVVFPDQPTLNEGRGGWAPDTYTMKDSYLGKDNSFWNPSTSKFDFSYYMDHYGFSDIDCVMLNIGTNGMTHVGASATAMDEIIASIHDYDSSIKIIVSLIIPPNDQNAGGYHYGMWDAAFYKMSYLNLIKRYISKYDDQMSNVYVSEPYFNMDTEYDYPTETVAVSSRNPATEVIHSDPLHPNQYGYLKMADVYYQNLVARLEN